MRGPVTQFVFEFVSFGVKQAWACLFGGLMLALLLATYLFYPDDAPLGRYDFLTLSALAIQIQPQHEATLAESARVPAHRHQLYEIIQRLLTCMGDLHRYRELHSAVPDRHHRVFFHFTRAVLFYHQAHVLLPDHGNPSNQLAVVATTVGDSFGAVYQYYRALCVRVPFDNARHNLQRMLEKALHAWSSSARRDDVLVAWR